MSADHHPALPPRRILCCVSEGTLSDAAVQATARLVASTGARAEFLHVLAMPPLLATKFSDLQIAAFSDDSIRRRREQIRAHFSHCLPDLQVGGRALEEQIEVVIGEPSHAVLSEAAGREVDLIVLGDNGHRKQLDFGGTARAVLAKSKAHVLVQPRDSGPVRRVLVPVDLSQPSLAALDGSISLARALGAALRVMHVYEGLPAATFVGVEAWAAPTGIDFAQLKSDSAQQFEAAMAAVDWRGVEHETALVEGGPVESILEAAADVDLVAMGTHGRTGLAAVLLGGVTYAVLRRSHTPVLAVRYDKTAFRV